MANELNNRKYTVPVSTAIAIPRETVQKILSRADGDAALVYLYILSEGSVPPLDAIAKRVRRGESDVARALGTLADLGLINRTVPLVRAESAPQYSPEDIEREMRNGVVFKSLVETVQNKLGTLLSTSDIQVLFSIYDYVGLPPEVIVMLVSYCCREMKRKYGSERTPTMRIIEREAYIWEREGIVTTDMADAYIQKRAERQSAAASIARLLHVDGRRLTTDEKNLFISWVNMGFDNDTILLAYDKTVNTTGKAAWKYMNKILLNWHGADAHTVEQVNIYESSRLKPQKQPKQDDNNTSSAGTVEELESLQRALLKMQTQ